MKLTNVFWAFAIAAGSSAIIYGTKDAVGSEKIKSIGIPDVLQGRIGYRKTYLDALKKRKLEKDWAKPKDVIAKQLEASRIKAAKEFGQ